MLEINAALSLNELDGVLLTGGGDIDPAHYKAAPHPKTAPPDQVRDRFELELARLALQSGLPMLGVCRGLQVINVAAGGTLIQDIPSEVNHPLAHQIDTPLCRHRPSCVGGAELDARQSHAGRVERRRSAAGQQPAPPGDPSSRRPASDVSATAPDAYVGAIEHPGAHFCVAVQWHPENFWRTGEFPRRSEEFVKACRRMP